MGPAELRLVGVQSADPGGLGTVDSTIAYVSPDQSYTPHVLWGKGVEAGAKALLTYLASAEAENLYLKGDPSVVGTNKNVDTAGYNAVQKKSAEIIGATANIAQFLDRDTRPDFASTVMIPSLQEFIKNPNDIAGLTKKIEEQKKTIFIS